MQNRKLEIVTRLRDLIPDENRESIDQAMITWWANIRRDGGMRLTNHGYKIMHDLLKLESWQLELSDPNDVGAAQARIDKKTILALDRKLEWPYYLDFDARKKRRRIIFFGSREAMMATLYGDIKSWLSSLGSR
jgi:hypothetical protein